MQRNRLALLYICVAGISGCARDSGLVYVNLNQLAESPSFAPIDGPSPVESASLDIGSRGLAALPSRQLYVKEFAEKLKEEEKKFEADRQTLYERLRHELQDAYLAEVRRIEKSRRAALEPEMRNKFETAFSRLRSIFEKYALEKWKPLVRLTSIVGFPDPDPGSNATTAPEYPQIGRLKVAQSARAEISSIDKAYREEVRKLLDSVIASNDEAIVKLKAAIVELESNALKEAEQEAKRLAFSAESMVPKDAGVAADRLPAVSAESIVVKNPKSTFRIKEDPAIPIAVAQRQWLESDLKVWLANKGYRLANTRQEGRDATREFAEWRRQFQIGP